MKLLVVGRDPEHGTPVKKTVTAEWVRVGRHASSEIYLPDPRIALAQGMFVWRDGLVYLEGESGISTKNTTHKAVRSERLAPGAALDVGPYRIAALAAPPGYDAAISVELARPLEVASALASRTSHLTLASLGFTKRWAAWFAGLVVLFFFLVMPAGRVLHLPWTHPAESVGLTDRHWDPGPVIRGHQPIEKKCEKCHEVAFTHVRDSACIECHKRVGDHVPAGTQLASLFAGQRCATCHREHKGVKATHRDDDAFCVGCHRDIRAKARETLASNASDFARDHPAFRVTLRADKGTVRVRQGEAPIAEKSNLRFPHDLHLDAKGVKSPSRGRVQMECTDCHKPDASLRSFEPISMEKRCQECHSLQFEPAVTARQVPHGKPDEAVAMIEDFYSGLALQGTPDSFQKAFGVPGEGLLRRTGSPSGGEREDALRLARRKAQRVAMDLFEVRACKQCHEVERYGDPARWDIAPVRLAAVRMPHARFDHKSHVPVKCADCHAVARSKSVGDVAMPTIAKCRECHGGSTPVEGKLMSNCMLCHGFHAH